MEKSDVFKSLLKQAGVTVLAGLLLSSAVVAEDASNDAGEAGFGAEVSADQGEVSGDEGTVSEGEGEGEGSAEEGSDGEAVDLGIEIGDEGVIDAVDDGSDEVDVTVDDGYMPEITECGFGFPELEVELEPFEVTSEPTAPDVFIDPIEMENGALAAASNGLPAETSVVAHSGKDVASKGTVFAGPKGRSTAENLR